MANYRALPIRGMVLCGLVLLSAAGCDKGQLEVLRIEPQIGPVEGGHVKIVGNGFQTSGPVGVTVYFGDKKGNVIDVADNLISARAPGGAAGQKVDVRLVFDNAREFVYRAGYQYREVNKGFNVTGLTQK